MSVKSSGLSALSSALDLVFHQNKLRGKVAYLVVGDSDLVLLSCALVARGDVQDTVGIDVEGDLDLGDASWCWRDGSQVELAKVMIVLCHGPLALVHLDGDGGLVVRVCGEGLGLLGGNGGVPLDEAGHNSSSSLDTKRQRSHVQQEQIGDSFTGVSSQDGGLDSSSVGNSLVRVDGSIELLPIEEVLEKFLDLGNPGGSSDKNDVINRALVHLGIPHGLLHRLQGTLEEV